MCIRDSLYTAGRISVPKGITILGGKYFSSEAEHYTVLLAQNNYGDAYAILVYGAENETEMNNRVRQMLEKINS